MDSTGVFLQEMLMLYGIAVLGFYARKSGILNENAIVELLTKWY